MKEMETLLPAAEKFAREGFGNRESWAKATLDFPELQLARLGVDLLLGCLATIVNVERLLKRVAHRGDVSTGVEMNDIFLCDAHAPKPHEVADAPSSHALVEHKAIVPKTPYLSKILGTYETIFGGRRWKEQPKKYRNAGVQKDPDALQKLRRDKGLPQTETDVLRTREAEIHNALEESVEQRAKKIAKGKWGGPVPKDTGKHVTPAIEKSAGPRLRGRRRRTHRCYQARAVFRQDHLLPRGRSCWQTRLGGHQSAERRAEQVKHRLPYRTMQSLFWLTKATTT